MVEVLWADISQNFGVWRGVGQLEREFQGERGSSTNECWCQKTRVPGISHGVVCVILRLAVLIQYQHTHTDIHTTRQRLIPARVIIVRDACEISWLSWLQYLSGRTDDKERGGRTAPKHVKLRRHKNGSSKQETKCGDNQQWQTLTYLLCSQQTSRYLLRCQRTARCPTYKKSRHISEWDEDFHAAEHRTAAQVNNNNNNCQAPNIGAIHEHSKDIYIVQS